MSEMASQITSLTIVYSAVYLRRRSKKTSKLRVTGDWLLVNSPLKAPVTRNMFPFDDVIMIFHKKRSIASLWRRAFTPEISVT